MQEVGLLTYGRSGGPSRGESSCEDSRQWPFRKADSVGLTSYCYAASRTRSQRREPSRNSGFSTGKRRAPEFPVFWCQVFAGLRPGHLKHGNLSGIIRRVSAVVKHFAEKFPCSDFLRIGISSGGLGLRRKKYSGVINFFYQHPNPESPLPNPFVQLAIQYDSLQILIPIF